MTDHLYILFVVICSATVIITCVYKTAIIAFIALIVIFVSGNILCNHLISKANKKANQIG